MEIPLEFVAFIAIILGLALRTILPYLKKLKEDPTLQFDFSYIGTAIISGVVSAIFIYPLFVFPENATWYTVFIAAFIFAWTADDVVNRVST